MPILSLNYGISDVLIVYVDDKKEFVLHKNSYPYSKEMYSHYISEKDFYTEMVTHFIRRFKIPRNNLKIIATGFPKIPEINYPYDHTIHLNQLIEFISTYNIMLLNRYSVFTQSGFMSHQDLFNIPLGVREKEYLANISIYRNISPKTISNYNLLLQNNWCLVKALTNNLKPLFYSKDPILFTGNAFRYEGNNFKYLTYLYMLNFILEVGVYELNYDPTNIYSNLVHIASFDTYYQDLLKKYKPKKTGTLVNSPGETSILLKTDIGTQQLVTVPEGKIFFMPLDENISAALLANSHQLGSVEKRIKGGEVGLIVDTRYKNEKDYTSNQLLKDMELNLKALNEVLSRL